MIIWGIYLHRRIKKRIQRNLLVLNSICFNESFASFMRATLRIVAGMLLGVLIAWLVHDLRTAEDPREMAKRYVTLSVTL